MSVDTWIKIWRGGFIVAFLGAGQFVVCFLIAMIFYAGGNARDRYEIGYSPARNHVSDLGRTYAISGQENATASRIFNGSLIVLGVGLVPYFVFMPMQAWDRPGWLTLAAVLGTAACVALVVMGFHPIDLHPTRHELALFSWLTLIFGCSSIHAGAMLTSRENTTLVLPLTSVGVAMLAIACGISATSSVAALLSGNPDESHSSAVLEKLLLLGVLAWVFTFSARMILVTDFSEYRDRRAAEDAEEYLREIERGPLRRH